MGEREGCELVAAGAGDSGNGRDAGFGALGPREGFALGSTPGAICFEDSEGGPDRPAPLPLRTQLSGAPPSAGLATGDTGEQQR